MKERIVKLLPEAIERAKKSLANDSFYDEQAQQRENIERIFAFQEKLLIEYAEEEVSEESLCQRFYRHGAIPYIVVIKSVKAVKRELLWLLRQDRVVDGDAVEVMNFFNRLIDQISRSYMRREVHMLKEGSAGSRFENFLLFRSHNVWFHDVAEAFGKERLERFPAVTADRCEFSRLMEYPESLMVCMDARLCTYLHTLHELLHESANTAYRYMLNGEYTQAYFMFKELLETRQKFESTLKDLYYLTYADLESSFFRLVEMFGYTDKRQVLTMIDLADLRHLNEIYGEEVLNATLDRIEERLQAFVRRYESSVLLVRGISANFYMLHIDWEEARYEEFCRDLRDVLPGSFSMQGKEVLLKYNKVGFELDSEATYTHEELIRIVMHLKKRAKKEGRPVAVFAEEEKRGLKAWLKEKYFNIEFIKEALAEGRVEALFQPIVDRYGKIAAVEALARIRRDNELLSAGLFIDTIYEIGMIDELDIRMLEALSRQQSLIERFEGRLFLNASPTSLANDRYIESLERVIEAFGNNRIMVEITEQQALENLDMIANLHKRLGVQFAIDDFGSGYSALKTVADLTENGVVRLLKIDGSLIKKVGDEGHALKIVEVVVNMCRTLGIVSLGEFVENEKTARRLVEMGVDYLQGYHFGAPMRAEEVLLKMG